MPTRLRKRTCIPLGQEIRGRAPGARSLAAHHRCGRSTDWSPETLRAALSQRAVGLRGHRRSPTASPTSTTARQRLDHPADPGQRPGRGAGAGDARLRRHMDRARQRQRRPRDGRRAATASRVPPGRPRLYAAPRLAHARRSRTATTTALPTKASGRCAISPSCGRSSARRTGSNTAPSTSASPTRVAEEASARIRSSSCRTITSRCCRR